jgi:N-acetylated-alpha-linked acidic dipeptidase
LKAALARLDAAPATRRNAVLMELARILVPVNYTREPRFRHDPAYTVPPLPTLAVAAELPRFTDPHERRCATVELMRGQNRFLAAMQEARRLVETAIVER